MRLAAMRSACTGLRHGFFRSASAAPECKLQVAKAVLLSKGLFNAGTWPALHACEMKRVHSAVMDVYGHALGFGTEAGRRLSHARLLEDYRLLAPAILVLFLRVCLFLRIATKGPRLLLPLLGLVAAPACTTDPAWMGECCQLLHLMPASLAWVPWPGAWVRRHLELGRVGCSRQQL